MIHRRPQQRIAEPDRIAGKLEHAHPGRLGGGRVRVDAGPHRRAPQLAALTFRIRRGQQRERLGVRRQAANLAQEVLPEPLP